MKDSKNKNTLPYASEKYYYTGTTNEYFTCGEQYTVIETGQHWYKGYGQGAWLTTDEDPESKDVDYCCFVPYSEFGKHKNFVKY
ncbi:hypothetical protein O0F56_08885 [Staphylococcus pseudintermedius]|nr:hypothetical protein [Staphylococcus pseudintermedius]HDV6107876.1 hypothetical protein [Staphylococcus pseudintermedius]